MRWLAVVLACCLAVLAWARTIPVAAEPRARTADELRRDLTDVAVEILSADAAYREYAVADSLLPLLPDTPGITVAISTAAEAQGGLHLIQAAAAEARSIPRPRARIGVFLIDDTFGRHGGIPLRVSQRDREIYTGSSSTGPYCVLVGKGTADNGEIANHAFLYARRSADRGLLGPCRFVARYGTPGPAIERWLASGAYMIAEAPGAVPFAMERRSFSSARLLWMDGDLRIRACAGGREARCADILTRPPASLDAFRRAVTQGAATFNLPPLYESEAVPYRLMLSSIEAEFGQERFARFWTSDREVPAAFAAAFGVDADAWVSRWSRSTYEEVRLGATTSAATALVSCLVVLVCSGLAAAIAARRTL